jgi:hypothetical protein
VSWLAGIYHQRHYVMIHWCSLFSYSSTLIPSLLTGTIAYPFFTWSGVLVSSAAVNPPGPIEKPYRWRAGWRRKHEPLLGRAGLKRGGRRVSSSAMKRPGLSGK